MAAGELTVTSTIITVNRLFGVLLLSAALTSLKYHIISYAPDFSVNTILNTNICK